MFERLLERILQNFLAPYVSGLSPEALHVGVRSGVLELQNLTVKPEALSLLGLVGYRVRKGVIGRASLHVSWKSLFTGRLYIAVNRFHLEAIEDIVPPEDMRVFKSRTIELRMGQLQDMLDQSQALQAGDFIEEGFLMRLNRKLLNNLTVNITDVDVWMITTTCPQAVGIELPGLKMTSTDTVDAWGRRQRADTNLNKLLSMDRLALRLSAAGRAELETATHVLSPMRASIRLTHKPAEKLFKLYVDLGVVSGEEKNKVVLRYSQWQHFFKVLAEAAKAAQALAEKLVPAEVQRALLVDVEANAKEYGRLYETQLLAGHGRGEPLSKQDQDRLQMLQDALPVRPLAQQRWLTAQCTRHLDLRKVQDNNSQEVEVSWAEKLGLGHLKSIFNCQMAPCATEEVVQEVDEGWFKKELRDRLMKEVDDVCKLEEVERPARTRLEFVFRELNVFLIDDQWATAEAKNLLSLVLPTALMSVEINKVVDGKGEDFTEWGIYCDFGAWQARHACQDVLKHLTTPPTAPSGRTFTSQGTAGLLPELGSHAPPVSVPMTRRKGSMEWEDDDRPKAAQLAVESKLDKEGLSSILKIEFKSTPFEIRLLPGSIGRIIDFFTINDAEVVAVAEQMVNEEDKVTSEYLLQGLEMYQQVQQQIPDRLFLDLLIAAPILRAPVEGRGNLLLCPGQLRLSMLEPCEYSKLDYTINLTDTVLSAVSVNEQPFNMIKPVPIEVQVSMRDTSTDVKVKVESLPLSLAPESFEMLIYLPETVNAIVESELPPQEAESLRFRGSVYTEGSNRPAPTQESLAPPSAVEDDFSIRGSRTFRSLDDPSASEDVTEKDYHKASTPRETKTSRREKFLEGAAAWVASDILNEDSFSQSPSGAGASAVVRGLPITVPRELVVTTTVYCDRITLTLADMLMSMLRLQLVLPPPGLTIKTRRNPDELSVDVDSSRLELEALCHTGVWHPVIETFSFGLQVRQPPDSSMQSFTGGASCGISARGQTPLLVNLTPTVFAKIGRSIELITEGLEAATSEAATGSKIRRTLEGAKYRVVNLSPHAMELKFSAPGNGGTVGISSVTKVDPTGSAWVSLDKFILPSFATGVTIREVKKNFSRMLSFELGGAVVIPGHGGYIAELFTPKEGDAHRVLLIAPRVRVVNLTDTPLQVRFHQGQEESHMDIHLESTMVCSAKVLGIVPSDEDRGNRASISGNTSKAEDLCDAGLILPGAMLAVPDDAVSPNPQSQEDMKQCWLSVGHMDTFSIPVRVGADVTPREVIRSSDAEHLHFIEWEATTHSCGQTSRCRVTIVKLRPPVLILNAVPLGTLHLQYIQQPPQQSKAILQTSSMWAEANEASVPRFGSFSLFNVSAAAKGDLHIRARLDESAPWCAPVQVPWSFFENGKEALTLEVLHAKRGASVGLSVEVIDGFKLRISCPFWFVDCTGIEKPLTLEVHQQRSKKQLPSEQGLTLLPCRCQEESISLVLCDHAGPQAHTLSTLECVMPPNWGVVSWPASNRPQVFCVQAERVDPRDVFGAECQAMVMKPRLVLTNASYEDIELLIGKSIIPLNANQSMEHHWAALSSDETPDIQLQFRPIPDNTEPQRSWSGIVKCSEDSAGSTPFLLRASPDNPSELDTTPDVWSVEIAPQRGSLAVSFKQSSNFIAKNNAPQRQRRRGLTHGNLLAASVHTHHHHNNNHHHSNSEVHFHHQMQIRPRNTASATPFSGFRRSTTAGGSEMIVEPGMEVPFGWPDPFGGTRQRSVDVIVNDEVYTIPDVRQSIVQKVNGTNLVIRVIRRGAQTLVLLESEGRPKTQGETGTLAVEVMLAEVGVSIIEEQPLLRELLYIGLEGLEFKYKDTDHDSHELQLEIWSAQVDCQLPGRQEESPFSSRISRVGMVRRSADIWRQAVVLRNVGSGPFLGLALQRSATSSSDFVLPKIDIEVDKIEVRMDDDWLEALISWCNSINSRGLDQVLSFADIERMAGSPITEKYSIPELPSVVQVESLSIANVKLLLYCRLRLHSLSFLPQYVLTAVRAVSLSHYFTLTGASVSLKRRTFPSHRGSLEDFVAALLAEYGRSVVANIFSLLHRSSLLNLPRAPLKIGHGAMTGMAKGVRHVAESANIEVFSPKSPNNADRDDAAAFKAIGRKSTEFKKVFSFMGKSSILQRTKANAGAKAKNRKRPPRLLLPAVGEVRPWSYIEASLLGHLGRSALSSVHEVVSLVESPRRCTFLLLCAEKILVTCIDLLSTGGSGRLSLMSMSSTLNADDTDPAGFYEKHYATQLRAAEEMQESANLRKTAAVVRWGDSEANSRKVRGLNLSAIKTACWADDSCHLQIEELNGTTHALLLPDPPVGKRVRQAILEGLRSATPEGDGNGDANWTALRSIMYGERRGFREHVLDIDVTPSLLTL